MKKRKVLSWLTFGTVAITLISCSTKNLNPQEGVDTDSGNNLLSSGNHSAQGGGLFGGMLGSSNEEKTLKLQQEKTELGLENLGMDTGWQNVNTSYSVKNTYGKVSKGSLKATVNKSMDKNSRMNYFISFMTDPSGSDLIKYKGIDFRSGILTFDYKPVNVTDPTTLSIYAVDGNWNLIKANSYKCAATNNGWYRCALDLSQFGVGDGGTIIRFNIGFDVASENLDSAAFYVDNMLIHENSVETDEQGLENHKLDTGMTGCEYEVDYLQTANESSSHSYQLNWKEHSYAWQNKNMYCINTQDRGIACNAGVLEAKFKFSEGFSTKQIRLVVVDANWKAYRVPVNPVAIENGWYLLKYDMSKIGTEGSGDSGFDASTNLIRLGFGFNDITADNKNDLTAWIDDVFISPANKAASVANAEVWQGYNTENILQTEKIANRGVTESAPLYFEDARNATDSTQLMITPTANVGSFDFAVGTLYNGNGGSLSASNFEVLVSKYIYVDSTSIEKNKEGWKGAGWYPDALVPIKNIKAAGENTITSGNTQSIWLNCSIPSSQVPGVYTGFGILTIDGVKYNVPMTVKVHEAVLANGTHNRSCLLTWDDQIEIGEGKTATNDLKREYFLDGLSKGINTGALSYLSSGGYTSFATNFADYIANDDRISTYRLPIGKDSNGNVLESDVSGYLDALIDKNIEEWDNGNHVNFFDKTIFYVNDEPLTPDGDSKQDSDVNKKSKEQWACVKNNLDVIKKYKNNLKSKLANYPELLASFEAIRNVLPMDVAADHISGDTYRYGTWNLSKGTYPNYFNTDYMDTPCPAFHHLTDESVREKYASTFSHTWFYGCLLPQLPYAGYHTDNKLINQRLITWMQYDYNFEGSVYWCTNYYCDNDYNARDVWNSPLSCGCTAGDGQLSYPGAKYGIFGPITSQRYETIRNSMKDYEYFYTFNQNLSAYKAKTGSTVNSCREYLSSAFVTMFNNTTAINTSYTSDVFEAVRTDLLAQLDLGL